MPSIAKSQAPAKLGETVRQGAATGLGAARPRTPERKGPGTEVAGAPLRPRALKIPGVDLEVVGEKLAGDRVQP